MSTAPKGKDSPAVVILGALKAYSKASSMAFGTEWVYAHRHPDGQQEIIVAEKACKLAYDLLNNIRLFNLDALS